MFESSLQDQLGTFYTHFDLLNKESAVKSTPPPEDWLLSESTENLSKAAEPDNIPGCVLKNMSQPAGRCHY